MFRFVRFSSSLFSLVSIWVYVILFYFEVDIILSKLISIQFKSILIQIWFDRVSGVWGMVSPDTIDPKISYYSYVPKNNYKDTINIELWIIDIFGTLLIQNPRSIIRFGSPHFGYESDHSIQITRFGSFLRVLIFLMISMFRWQAWMWKDENCRYRWKE